MALNNWNRDLFDLIFGESSSGDSIEVRAKTSRREFVRSQLQIAFANERATGRKLSALEALNNFGSDILIRLAEDNAVPLILKSGEPGKTISARRRSMGLSVDTLARAADLGVDDLESFESGSRTLPFRTIESLCRFLVLDESVIGYRPGAGGDQQLGVRFKEFFNTADDAKGVFNESAVLRLSDAAWVIKKQLNLNLRLGLDQKEVIRELNIKPSNDYQYPVHEKGYYLANKTRQLLGLDESEPIGSLIDLMEKRLHVPVVHLPFSSKFAGATIAPGDNGRGIVVNTSGANKNIWVRRSTLAHELAHLLWDPDGELNKLVVDEYDDFEWRGHSGESDGMVEARANAFAIEFLAPKIGASEVFKSHQKTIDGVRAVMERYGVGFIAARWQLINSGLLDPNDKLSGIDTKHTSDWSASEEASLNFFPIASVPDSRRGGFLKAVVDAAENGIISDDTASSYLSCSVVDFTEHKKELQEYF